MCVHKNIDVQYNLANLDQMGLGVNKNPGYKENNVKMRKTTTKLLPFYTF